MQRFKSILLVYPCDQATLERATSLSRANRAKLTLLRVERELTGTSLITSPGSPAPTTITLLHPIPDTDIVDFHGGGEFVGFFNIGGHKPSHCVCRIGWSEPE